MAPTAAMPFPEQIRQHLRYIRRGMLRDVVTLLFALPSKALFCFTRWNFWNEHGDPVPTREPEKHALDWAVAQSEAHQNVYLTTNPLVGRPLQGRGGSDLVALLSWITADVDILGGTHKRQKLAPSLQKAVDVLRSHPLEPSFILSTGGGVQAWWRVDPPGLLHDARDRKIAERLLQAHQDFFRRPEVNPEQWGVDSTWDLARVLRLAGTVNYKDTEPRPVRFLSRPKQLSSYTLKQFAEATPLKQLRDENRSETSGTSVRLTDQALLKRILASRQGEQLQTLWRGENLPHHASDSEGDMALARLLAFWTGPERERIANLMRRSQRDRDKFERADYLPNTIARVLEGMTEFWGGR